MSSTADSFASCACKPGAHTTVHVLPEGFFDDLMDQMAVIEDVQHSVELLEAFVNPIVQPGVYLPDLDREQVGAQLRLINTAFYTRLAVVKGMLAEAQKEWRLMRDTAVSAVRPTPP